MTKKKNDLRELRDLIARLPWWLGFLLATASGGYPFGSFCLEQEQ